MLLSLLMLILAYWLIASILAFYLATKAFKKYRNYPKVEVPEHYQGFMRQDFGKWNQQAIKVGCFLRFPFKFAVLMTYLVNLSILSALHNRFKLPRSVVELWRRNAGRLSNKVNFQLTEHFDPTQEITTPIVIANHSNLLDPNYLASCFRCVSVIVKAQAKSAPLFSQYMKYSKCLFVDRGASVGRSPIFTDLNKRVNQFANSKDGSACPVLIFPEGTVSNGRAIMQFKNGAFDTLSPITIFSLRYECEEFHMAQDEVDPIFFSVIALCLNSKLIVKKQTISAQKDESVEEYRQRCRRILAEMCNFKIYECNFSHYLEYLKLRKQSAKKSE